MDLEAIRRLLGHATFTVIRRYLAQAPDDLRATQRMASPVDNLPILD